MEGQKTVQLQKTDEVYVTIGNKLNIKRHKAVWQMLSWGFASTFLSLLALSPAVINELGIQSLLLLGITVPGTALLFGSMAFCAGMYTIGSFINVFAPGCNYARFFKSFGKALFGVGLAAVGAILFFNPMLLGRIATLVSSLDETMALTLEIYTFAFGVFTAISAICPRMFKYIGHGSKCLFGNCSKSEEMTDLSDKKVMDLKCEDVSTCQKYLDSYDPMSRPEQKNNEQRNNEID